MSFQPDIRQCRQMAYKARARRAFFWAKLLIPCTFFAISASAWSDPVLGPKLQTGLDEVKPMVDAVMDGAPVGDVLAEAGWSRTAAAANETAEDAPEPETVNAAASLPTSVVPINRPAPATAPDS